MHELSFYSIEHGGTFHFFQFNILKADEFLASAEFGHLCGFLKAVFANQSAIEMSENKISAFFHSLEHRKQVIDLQESIHIDEQMARKLPSLSIPPILSTGGYNDKFLHFVSNVFASKILKCHNTLSFVIKAIDYINRTTNDCFFKLIGPVNTKINESGKID